MQIATCSASMSSRAWSYSKLGRSWILAAKRAPAMPWSVLIGVPIKSITALSPKVNLDFVAKTRKLLEAAACINSWISNDWGRSSSDMQFTFCPDSSKSNIQLRSNCMSSLALIVMFFSDLLSSLCEAILRPMSRIASITRKCRSIMLYPRATDSLISLEKEILIKVKKTKAAIRSISTEESRGRWK